MSVTGLSSELMLGRSYVENARQTVGLGVDTPFGPISFRGLDHQSTMGAYVGRTAVKDGKGVMIDWRYADGSGYLPSDDTVKRLRPPD